MERGITGMTNISASYRVGVMFTIVVVSLQSDGIKYFERVLCSKTMVQNMRECFQMILCYWMWLKKKKYWKIDDKNASSKALRAIRKMLSRMKTFWPRETGQGWDLPKFHEQLHVIDDIIWNGAPAGSFSGPLENNFIPFVKKPSKRTQRRRKQLDAQIAQRNYETYLIENSLYYMETIDLETKKQPKQTCKPPKITGSKGRLKFKMVDGTTKVFYKKNSPRLNEETLNYLLNDYEPIQDTIKAGKTTFLTYHSEFKKDGKVFRGHNNFQKEGPWNDWVMIRWERDGNYKQDKNELKKCHVIDSKIDQKGKRKFLYSPGQIQCFISPKQGVYHAIVKCCNYKFSRGSVFSTEWKQEYIYHNRQKNSMDVSHKCGCNSWPCIDDSHR